MLRPWFTTPLVLHLLWILPLLFVGGALTARHRQRAGAALGPLAALRLRAETSWREQVVRLLSLVVGSGMLILATAGPRWGRVHEAAFASGRDVVLVLDLSRSMLARDVLPNRLERAKEALADLTRAVEKRGGHRLALVVFAARPRLVCPLTHDYEHVRQAVLVQDAGSPHPDLRAEGEASLSGTRLGAALRLAVESHDPRYQGAQDILLLSDGDDPARDAEWRAGADAARAAGIPIHVIGIGDPETPTTIPDRKDEPFRHEDQPVRTRLEEAELRDIAHETRGTYTPAHTRPFHLGELFRERIESAAFRADTEEVVTLYQPRQAWFFLAALVIVPLDWLLGRRRGAKRAVRNESAARAAALLLLLPCLLSGCATLAVAARLQGAGPSRHVANVPPQRTAEPRLAQPLSAAPRTDWQQAVREADHAFTRGEYARAVQLYEQAEEWTTEPGLVSFNKAAALYQLGLAEEQEGRQREFFQRAERHYRQALEDATGQRRVRALFDLGNALLQQAQEKDARLLEQAVAVYEACLRELREEPTLRGEAEYNLELAKVLWLRAQARRPAGSEEPETAPPDTPTADPKPGPEKPGQPVPAPGKPNGTARQTPGKVGDPGQGNTTTSQAPPAGRGNLPPLPDEDGAPALTPEESMAYLQQAAERIEQERVDYLRRSFVPPSRTVKDW